jgi:putative hemolysin
MTSVVLEIAVLLLLLLLNGVLAMAEMSLVSARKARLLTMAGDGNLSAARALELAQSPNQFLSTVQIGITLVGILAGAFGGATIAQLLADQLVALGLTKAIAESAGLSSWCSASPSFR